MGKIIVGSNNEMLFIYDSNIPRSACGLTHNALSPTHTHTHTHVMYIPPTTTKSQILNYQQNNDDTT